MNPPPTHVIALVENDLPTNRALSRLLRANGYGVEAYTSGESLLARTLATAIDCLLLDVELDGMSGIALQHQLRALAVAYPIIFISGRDDPAAGLLAVGGGGFAFLAKPVGAGKLFAAIALAMARSAHRSFPPIL
ncbi:MAG: response regulator transcription factor [Telluria sp.]